MFSGIFVGEGKRTICISVCICLYHVGVQWRCLLGFLGRVYHLRWDRRRRVGARIKQVLELARPLGPGRARWIEALRICKCFSAICQIRATVLVHTCSVQFPGLRTEVTKRSSLCSVSCGCLNQSNYSTRGRKIQRWLELSCRRCPR